MAKASTNGASGKATVTIEIGADALTFTAALPESISQLTCLQVCGISPRIFLEVIRSPDCPVAVMKLGNLRIVDRAEFMAWLRSRAGVAPSVAATAGAPANDSSPVQRYPEGADAVLAEIGLERVSAEEPLPAKHERSSRRTTAATSSPREGRPTADAELGEPRQRAGRAAGARRGTA